MHAGFDWPALEQRLLRHVTALATTPRPPGTSAHRQVQAYIEAHLRQAGFTPRPVPYAADPSMPGTNFLTDPLPDAPNLPLVIIGAHYDSIPGSPGADDNASAVAALLELAAWLGPHLGGAGGWRARLQLAAYDEEEFGLLGSEHHAGQVAGPVRGMVSLEMLGYTDRRPGSQRLPPHLKGLYSDVGDFIGIVGNQASRGLVEIITAGMKQVPGLPVESLAVPGNGGSPPESRLSDHASFWDRGHPALMITDTSFFRNPHYHQITDTPDTLDYPFLAKVTAGVCQAVAGLLQS